MEMHEYYDREYTVLANWEIDKILEYAQGSRKDGTLGKHYTKSLNRFITKIKNKKDFASSRMQPILRVER